MAMTIDRQRIAAVKVLETIGYKWREGSWQAPAGTTASVMPVADAMYGVIREHVDALAGAPEGSDEELELIRLADLVAAYEAIREPD